MCLVVHLLSFKRNKYKGNNSYTVLIPFNLYHVQVRKFWAKIDFFFFFNVLQREIIKVLNIAKCVFYLNDKKVGKLRLKNYCRYLQIKYYTLNDQITLTKYFNLMVCKF